MFNQLLFNTSTLVFKGWGCSSVAEHLLSKCEALASLSNLLKKCDSWIQIKHFTTFFPICCLLILSDYLNHFSLAALSLTSYSFTNGWKQGGFVGLICFLVYVLKHGFVQFLKICWAADGQYAFFPSGYHTHTLVNIFFSSNKWMWGKRDYYTLLVEI